MLSKMAIECFHRHPLVCTAVSSCILVLVCVLTLFACLWLCRKDGKPHHRRHRRADASGSGISQSSRATTRLHRVNPVGEDPPPFFNWADHPNLAAEAAEKGWSGFDFKAQVSNPGGSDGSNRPGNAVVCGWEVCEGSGHKAQRIEANPGLCKALDKGLSSACVAIRAGLPLPGPCLGRASFPQEAFFEITILSCDNDKDILDDSLDDEETSWLCVGLTGSSNPLPWRFPGSYEGSVGFNSNGSVYLNGTKLISQTETNGWGKANKTVGCGYKPSEKRVFFTVGPSLAQEVHCDDEVFEFPLFPTLALTTAVTVLINLGQNPFEFLPENARRNPNPELESVLGYPDSGELFSLGSFHFHGLVRSGTVKSSKAAENGHESESERFEIALDGP